MPDPGDIFAEVEVVGPFQENTWFVGREGTREVVVIDPGDEALRLLRVIAAREWQPVAVVNTHAHLDHVGAVAALRREFGIPFYLHPDAREMLAEAPRAALSLGLPPPEVPEVDESLADGQELVLAGLSFAVHHTPGHAPGHVTLVLPGHAFVGDCIFRGSIGRTDLPGGDLPTLLRSIRERILTLPEETILHSGHGPDTTVGFEAAHNPFLQSY